MAAIFLSASVPIPGRGPFFETANPFLIQVAVRELVVTTIREYTLVWGGHPAITPMIWAVCEDLGVEYSKSVVLYQSRFFEEEYPEENKYFDNVVYVDAVSGDRDQSIAKMRHAMLSRDDLIAAVFIGGMDGIFEEYRLFRSLHSDAKVLLIASPGGAARALAIAAGSPAGNGLDDVDFARIFRDAFGSDGHTTTTVGS